MSDLSDRQFLMVRHMTDRQLLTDRQTPDDLGDKTDILHTPGGYFGSGKWGRGRVYNLQIFSTGYVIFVTSRRRHVSDPICLKAYLPDCLEDASYILNLPDSDIPVYLCAKHFEDELEHLPKDTLITQL